MIDVIIKEMTQTKLNIFDKSQGTRKKRMTRLESGLIKYDKNTFDNRLRRLQYINKIFPKGLELVGEPELVYTFSEAKDCFIAGHFIATIILTQSFVEKVIHNFFLSKQLDPEAKRGLANMIKYAKKKQLIHEYILNKVDELRLRRNPFTHLKDVDYPHRFINRMFENQLQPHQQLEKDAMEAIQIMFFISQHKF